MIVKFPSPIELVANLKAALLAACVDPARAHMNCVRVEIRRNVARFVATSGHWLWVNEIRVDAPGDAALYMLIGLDDVKRIVKGIGVGKRIVKGIGAGKKQAAWDVELDTVAKTFAQLGTSIAFDGKRDASRFPPYAQIIPANTGEKRLVMTLASEYLGDVFAAFSLLAKDPGITIETGDTDADPCVFVSKACPDALAIMMPRRDTAADSEALRNRYRAFEPQMFSSIVPEKR